MKKTVLYMACGCLLALAAIEASADTVVWSQGFETDTAGWLDNDELPGFGNIARVGTGAGSLGLPSATGSWHGEVQQIDAGPFSRFDMYRSVWPDGMIASIDIYLDTNWLLGEGFDYSVAANGTDNAHERDFIFHVTKDTSTGSLLVGGSNNTNFNPREDLETLNHYEVTGSGWYTFEHVFYDIGDGSLAVDLNLRDSGGALLFTETRNNAADLLGTVVGGNRYGWFTNIDIAGGVAIDNHTLTIGTQAPVPEPATMTLLGLGLAGLGLRARRRKSA